MSAHRAKIHTENGDFVFSLRGALGVSPLMPATQEEDVRIEFLDPRGLRYRYIFRTFSEFFYVLQDAAVPVDGRDAGHE